MKSSKEGDCHSLKSIEWPRQLKTPRELAHALSKRARLEIVNSPLCSRLVLQFIGGFSYILANFLNKSSIHNWNVFKEELSRIESIKYPKESQTSSGSLNQEEVKPRGPLITLSNHISCIDDPIVWGALLPFSYYFTKTDSVRWSAAAVDICFSKPWHSTFFALGRSFPIRRGVGLEQPAMDYALALLEHNEWLHLFPEGRVMRDENQQVLSNIERGYIFKWGIAKLILDYFERANYVDENSEIRVLPFYHLGLDKILPIGRPYIPRFGKKMTIYIRSSAIRLTRRSLQEILINRNLHMRKNKSKSNDEIRRIKLTNYLEEELEKLREPATLLHHKKGR